MSYYEVIGNVKVAGAEAEEFFGAPQAATEEQAKEKFRRFMMRRKGAESVTIKSCRLMDASDFLQLAQIK